MELEKLDTNSLILGESRNEVKHRYFTAVNAISNILSEVTDKYPGFDYMLHAGGALAFYNLPEFDIADIDIVVTGMTVDYLRYTLQKYDYLHKIATISNKAFSKGTYLGKCLELQIHGYTVHIFNPIISEVEISNNIYSVPFNHDTFQHSVLIEGTKIKVARLEDVILYKLMLLRGKVDLKRDYAQVISILKYKGLDWRYFYHRIIHFKLSGFLAPIYYYNYHPQSHEMPEALQSDLPSSFFYIAGQLLKQEKVMIKK